jgi:hypothetical protein
MMMQGLADFKLRVKCIHFLIVVGGFLTVNFKFENLCSYYEGNSISKLQNQVTTYVFGFAENCHR